MPLDMLLQKEQNWNKEQRKPQSKEYRHLLPNTLPSSGMMIREESQTAGSYGQQLNRDIPAVAGSILA